VLVCARAAPSRVTIGSGIYKLFTSRTESIADALHPRLMFVNKSVTALSIPATLGFLAACASDKGGSIAGGDSGIGGDSAATDVGAALYCTPSITIAAPTDGLIADFTETDAGINMMGGAPYVYPPGSGSAPTYATTGGSLQLTVNAPATSQAQFLGVIIGPEIDCIDATAFSGVQFSISGAFSGCTFQYASADDEHRASSAAGHYQPKTQIATSQLSTTPQTLKMPFSDQVGGNPATPIDKSQLVGIFWEFDVAPITGTAPSSCVADITIDDVKFY